MKNRTDLAKYVARHTATDVTDAKAYVDSVFNGIKEFLTEDGIVSITGFGTFKRIDRKPRNFRDFKTGENVIIELAPTITLSPSGKCTEEICN